MTLWNARVRVLACSLLPILAMSLASCATTPKAEPRAEMRPLPGTVWINPVIKDFGEVHPRPDAAVQPDPNAEYKVIVDVVHGSDDHTAVLGSLQRLARTVNLLGYAKVPSNHVHIVAVIEGQATFATASNATYRKFFKVDNPNLKILHELKQAGVELFVCGQALAEGGLVDTDVGPDITVSLSALSDFVVYGHLGYSYMQL
ncbi:DsrE family protein [Rhodanobacter sp. AS-Z3]|uniref:DsrE family protein n=1 Tax=Rhodanobacter sp. AS-Z3 TaxID=3031330 RepID=UPI002479A434|nr:DsrE family protein [Rhodanobacter sp. AS-Z3]WEN14031.1 DsrE family protein [Rhodanobacter sp. AS-Z3]